MRNTLKCSAFCFHRRRNKFQAITYNRKSTIHLWQIFLLGHLLCFLFSSIAIHDKPTLWVGEKRQTKCLRIYVVFSLKARFIYYLLYLLF